MLRIVSNTRLIEYKPLQKPFCNYRFLQHFHCKLKLRFDILLYRFLKYIHRQ